MINVEIGFLNKEKIVIKYKEEFFEFAKRYDSDSIILVLSDTVIEKAQVNYIRLFE